MKLEWSDEALADLTRFAAFVEVTHPNLSERVAQAIIGRAELLIEYPLLGRPMAGREHYREIVLEVLNAQYVFQYWFDGTRLVMLRVFHGRERR